METRRLQTGAAPRGWNPGKIEHRFADVSPQSYDKAARTVDAVLSMARRYNASTAPKFCALIQPR